MGCCKTIQSFATLFFQNLLLATEHIFYNPTVIKKITVQTYLQKNIPDVS